MMVKLSVQFFEDQKTFHKNFEDLRGGRSDFNTVVINSIPSINLGFNLLSDSGFEMEILSFEMVQAIILRVDEKVDENFNQQPKKFSINIKKAILIAFQSTINGHESKTFWRLPSGEKYFSTFIDDDAEEDATSYFHDFLIEEIKEKRAGLMSTTDQQKYNLDLDEIGHEDNNLLYLAIMSNEVKAVKSFLDKGLDPESNKTSLAIDAAWKKFLELSTSQQAEQQEKEDIISIIMSLLNANSRFPTAEKGFEYENAPNEVKDFLDKCEDLHTSIDQGDFKKFGDDIKKDANLVYYYNRHNQSVFVYGLKSKKYQIINYIKEGLSIGNHENLDEIYEGVDRARKREICKENTEQAIEFPNAHILMLCKKSNFISKNQKNVKKFSQIVNEGFLTINENEYCSKILKIAANWTELNFYFDCNHDHTKFVDPTSSIYTRAKIFTDGKVLIAAKNLEEKNEKFFVFGTVIHELCHAAMLLIFRNNFEPYMDGENSDKIFYEEAFAKCLELQENNWFVKNAFEYNEKYQHSEMIVTYPQMLITYFKDNEEIEYFQQTFTHLVDYSENTLGPELDRGLAVLKMLDDPTRNIKYDDLTPPLQIKVLNSKVKFEGSESSLRDLYKENSEIVNKLTPKDLRDLLMTKKLIEIVQSSNSDGNFSKVLERKFVDRRSHEDHLLVDIEDLITQKEGKNQSSVQKETKNQSNIQNQEEMNSEVIIQKKVNVDYQSVNPNLKNDSEFEHTSPAPHPPLVETKGQKDFNKIKKESKDVVISDFPGSGTSTFLKTAARKLKKENLNVCVSYINLHDHQKIYEKFVNESLEIGQVLQLFEEILKEIPEVEVKKLSAEDRTIFLLDGFDKIYSKYGEMWLKIFSILKENSKIELWVSSSPGYIQELEGIFNVQAYKFAHLTEGELRIFIKNILRGNKIEDEAMVEEMTEKVIEFLKYLTMSDNLTAYTQQFFESEMNNLSLIEDITYLYCQKDITLDPSNLYEIFSKIDYKMYKKFEDKNLDKSRSKPTIHDVHDILALKTIFGENQEYKNGFKLSELAVIKDFNSKNTWTFEAVRKYGVINFSPDYKLRTEEDNLKKEDNNLKSEVETNKDVESNPKFSHSNLKSESNLKNEDSNLRKDPNLKTEENDPSIENNSKSDKFNLKIFEPKIEVGKMYMKAAKSNLTASASNILAFASNISHGITYFKTGRSNSESEGSHINKEGLNFKKDEGVTKKLEKIDPNLKIEEPNLKVDELNLKVDKPNLKIDNDNLKIEESNLKVDDTNLKSNKQINKIITEDSNLKTNEVEKFNLKIGEISVNFIHKSFAEYFVARFVVEFFTNLSSGIKDEEIVKTFKLLEILAEDGVKFKKIREFIFSSNEIEGFDEKFKKLLSQKIQKIHDKMRRDVVKDSTYNSFEFFAKIFKNDKELEEKMWKIGENHEILTWKEKAQHLMEETQHFATFAVQNYDDPKNIPKYFQELNIFEKILYPQGELKVDFAIKLAEYCFGSDWHEKMNQSGEKLITDAETEEFKAENAENWEDDKNILKIRSFVDKNFSIEKREKFFKEIAAMPIFNIKIKEKIGDFSY